MKTLLKISMIISLLFISFTPISAQKADAFSPQVIHKGSTGDDVLELQARLQYIGIYRGEIDGIFGWETYWAVKKFQSNYGMKSDGLAGTAVKNKLKKVSQYNEWYVKNNIKHGWKFTYYGGTPLDKQTEGTYKAPSSKKNAGGGKTNPKPPANPKVTIDNLPDGISRTDLKMLANAVFGESRGEPYKGQVAVAAVILNRVDSPKFPDTIQGVIFQPGAFTAVSDGQIWLTPDKEAKQAVMDALNGWDPSSGALYYFNPDTATSAWIWTRPQIKQIGEHIFTK